VVRNTHLWKLPDSKSTFFDNHNSARSQSIHTIDNHVGQAPNDKRGSSVAQTEKYDTGLSAFGKRHDLAKIEIKCQHDSRLCNRLFEDATIGQALKSFIA